MRTAISRKLMFVFSLADSLMLSPSIAARYGVLHERDMFIVFAVVFMVVGALLSNDYPYAGSASAILFLSFLWSAFVARLALAASKINVNTVPHFRLALITVLIVSFGFVLLLATAYMMLRNGAIIGFVVLWAAHRFLRGRTRMVTMGGILVLTQIAAMSYFYSYAVDSGTNFLYGAALWQLVVGSVVSVILVSAALFFSAPIAGFTCAVVAVLAWSLLGLNVDYLSTKKVILAAEFTYLDIVRYGMGAMLLLVLCAIFSRSAWMQRVQSQRNFRLLGAYLNASPIPVENARDRFDSSQSLMQSQPVFNWMLKRACDTSFNFSRLIPFAFPRDLHWSSLCLAGALLTALFYVAFFIMRKVSLGNFEIVFPYIYLLCTQLIVCRRINAAYVNKPAHALLSLAPNWPKQKVVNHAIAKNLFTYYLVFALVSIAALHLAAWLSGFDEAIPRRQTIRLEGAALVGLICTLRATGKYIHSGSTFVVANLGVLIGGMMIGGNAIYGDTGVLSEIIILLLVPVAILRYYFFMRSPPALPAASGWRPAP